jgi:hypothetical protein
MLPDDTRKDPGNANLGNLDAEGIYASVRDHFQAEPNRRFCGNGVGKNKIDFLTFIKDIQAARHLFQVIRKAKVFLVW